MAVRPQAGGVLRRGRYPVNFLCLPDVTSSRLPHRVFLDLVFVLPREFPMKTPLATFRCVLFSVVAILSASLTAAHAGEPDFGTLREGSRLHIFSPFFVFSLDTADGLRAVKWENRMTGKTVSLGRGLGIGRGCRAARRSASDADVASRSIRPPVGGQRSGIRTFLYADLARAGAFGPDHLSMERQGTGAAQVRYDHQHRAEADSTAQRPPGHLSDRRQSWPTANRAFLSISTANIS